VDAVVTSLLNQEPKLGKTKQSTNLFNAKVVISACEQLPGARFGFATPLRLKAFCRLAHVPTSSSRSAIHYKELP
jgi:hypothetical protein